MNRCVDVRAGVLDDPPPVEVEAVFLEVELLLQLDPRHAEEGRKVRRHGVGQIDRCLEAPGRRRRLGGCLGSDGCRGKAGGGRSLEEPAAAERRAHRLLASRDTHDGLHSLSGSPPSMARGPCGAQLFADDIGVAQTCCVRRASASQRAPMLDIDDLSVRVAGRLLIDQATARITPGSRVGLVGRNGSGKSTLFNVITGDHPSEQGRIELPPRWRVGRLAQEAPNGPESLIDVVLARRRRTRKPAGGSGHRDRPAPDRRNPDCGLPTSAPMPRRRVAASILSGLGFSEADQARPCSEFSGGWRMRVALAAVLFSKPDLLLLDEPTNYLDLEGTLWLQDHLARYPHTMIVISHDRDLLDTSVNFILSLENAKLTLYRGGYSAFEKLRNERLLLDQKMP